MGPGRRFAKPNPFSSLWQVAAGGTSVAPPAITVAVSGLDATITNTGGAADSINWGDGTTNTSLTRTYATAGPYTIVATNAGGSSTAYAQVARTLAIDASLTLYSDAAGTTPATTTGTGILNAPDQSGSGNTLVRSSGAGGVLRIEGSTRTIGFEGGYLNKDVSSGSLSAFTKIMLCKTTVPYGTNAVFSFGAGAASPFIATQWVLAQFETFGITTPNNTCAPIYQWDNNWRLVAVTYNGTDTYCYFDDALISSYSGGTPNGEPSVASFTRAGYGLGKETTFGNAFSGRIAELDYYETYATAAQIRGDFARLRAKWSALFNTTDPQVLIIGNSLMSGLVASSPNELPNLIVGLSTKIERYVAAARPSITTAQIVTRFTEDYSKLIVAPNPRVVVIWEGTNSFAVGGLTAAQAYDDLILAVAAARAAGATYVIVADCIDRNVAGFTTFQNAYRTLVQANTAGADATIILSTVTGIGPAGSSTGGNFADGIHLNAAGNAIAAPYFQSAIDAALP